MFTSQKSAQSLTPIEVNTETNHQIGFRHPTPPAMESRASSAEGKVVRVKVIDSEMTEADDFYDAFDIDNDEAENTYFNNWTGIDRSDDKERDGYIAPSTKDVINIEQDYSHTEVENNIDEMTNVKHTAQIEGLDGETENENEPGFEHSKENETGMTDSVLAKDFVKYREIAFEDSNYNDEADGDDMVTSLPGEELYLKNGVDHATKTFVHLDNRTDNNMTMGPDDTDRCEGSIDSCGKASSPNQLSALSGGIAKSETVNHLDREDSVETSYFASFGENKSSKEKTTKANVASQESPRDNVEQFVNNIEHGHNVHQENESNVNTETLAENEESYNNDLSVFAEHNIGSEPEHNAENTVSNLVHPDMTNASIFLEDALNENNKEIAANMISPVMNTRHDGQAKGDDDDKDDKEDNIMLDIKVKVDHSSELQGEDLIPKNDDASENSVTEYEKSTHKKNFHKVPLTNSNNTSESLDDSKASGQTMNDQHLNYEIPDTEHGFIGAIDEAIGTPESSFNSEPDEQSILRVFISSNQEEQIDNKTPLRMPDLHDKNNGADVDFSRKSSSKLNKSGRHKSATPSHRGIKKNVSSPYSNSSMSTFKYGGDNTAINRLKQGPYAEVFKRDVPKAQPKTTGTKDNHRKNTAPIGPKSPRKNKIVSSERNTGKMKPKDKRIVLKKTGVSQRLAPNKREEENNLALSDYIQHDSENNPTQSQCDKGPCENLSVVEKRLAILPDTDIMDDTEGTFTDKVARDGSQNAPEEPTLNDISTAPQSDTSQDSLTPPEVVGEQADPRPIASSVSDKLQQLDEEINLSITQLNEGRQRSETLDINVPEFKIKDDRHIPSMKLSSPETEKSSITETNDIKAKATTQKEAKPSIRDWSANKQIIISSPKTTAKMADKSKETSEKAKNPPKVKMNEIADKKKKTEKISEAKNVPIVSGNHMERHTDTLEPTTITVIDETSELDEKTENRAGRLIINNIKKKLRNSNIKRHTSSSSVASIQLHASSRSPSPEDRMLNSSVHPIAYKTQSMSSLQVPGHLSTSNPWDPTKEEDTLSMTSRRPSVDSVSRKSVDYRIRNTTMVIQPHSDEKPKTVFTSDETYIQSAVPCLPMSLAVVCLILNVVLPGSGTALSGLSILCCGHTRLSNKEDQLLNSLCANILVGIAQLFTVSFLLVGWFWSISWGIKMVSVSVRHREELKQQREKELQALALSAFGSPKRVNLFGS